ncbi:hypothetical protein BDR26DRAFT_895044 [Obelidium mucronatum]|nr:hypothetical protein BDR26DRAFT_895044 [Obelidium mucronatum]
MDNPPQYIVADYLAEVTMGILARQTKGSKGGYVTEFVEQVYTKNATVISKKNIKVITNAGGLDPLACKAAIEAAAAKIFAKDQSQIPIVAAVFGDDIWTDKTRRDALEKAVSSNTSLPFGHLGSSDTNREEWPKGREKSILSVNVYLGAAGILQALNSKATIIVTGRVVDSALVLAPLMHEFKWSPLNYNLLAAGSLAGHIIECGCHTTGGNFTDWRLSANSPNGGWSNMGYPIVEVENDGSFIVTKPPRTGGLVSIGTVSEQMIYEVLDPANYILPDVVLDMTQVQISQVGVDRVLVTGARGKPPTPFLKTSGVFVDGFKMSGELVIGGAESVEKAKHVADAILKRVGGVLKKMGQEDFTDSNIECLGSEHTYGPNSKATRTRETVLRITVCHQSQIGLTLFAREIPAAATCMAPGITGFGSSARPSPSPNLRHFSILVPKTLFPNLVSIGSGSDTITVTDAVDLTGGGTGVSASGKQAKVVNNSVPLPSVINTAIATTTTTSATSKKMVRVRLIELCYGRSGDKGDSANIGLIAREPKYYPHLVQTVTADKVKSHMRHLILGSVERFELPGAYGLNFVATKALGGGGLSSLRVDRQGKTYGQMLLQMKIEVPESWGLVVGGGGTQATNLEKSRL